MTALLYRMAAGVPGAISRPTAPTSVEAQVAGAVQLPAYGLPVKLSGNTVIPLALVGDTTPYGFVVRPYPSGLTVNDPLGTSTPPAPGVIVGVMRRGYMTVYCRAGTPAIGAAVYVRYANPSGVLIVGGLEATSVGGSNVALIGVQWQSGPDANGIAEISFGGPNN